MVIAPLREQRRQVDGLKLALRAIDAPPAGLDISPVTQQLQRRLQEQSILYLMGPQRILDRVRQVPGLLLRLPRTAWDLVMRGESAKLDAPTRPDGPNTLPDFPAILADQFAVFQSRLADLLTSTPLPQNPPKASSTTQDSALSTQDSTASTQHSALSTQDSAAFPLLPRSDAASIAQEELADLKRWLEERWHATPRDTAMLQRLLKHLPGGKALGKWSEAAPYLLAIIVATHHAFFGPVDLLILGSFSLATWLGEKAQQRSRLANAPCQSAHRGALRGTGSEADHRAVCVAGRTVAAGDRAGSALSVRPMRFSRPEKCRRVMIGRWFIGWHAKMLSDLRQLVTDIADLTGSPPPALLADDAPVLAPRALQDSPDGFYLVGLIGGKDVGKRFAGQCACRPRNHPEHRPRPGH